MREFSFLILVVAACLISQASTGRLDSLQRLLQNFDSKDSTYVDLLNEIGFEYSLSDQKSSSYYINLAARLAKETGYTKGLIRAQTLKGNSFLIIGLPDEALKYYLEALNLKAEDYALDYIKILNNIGEVYRRKEVYDSSMAYFMRALKTIETRKLSLKPTILYSNLGEVNLNMGKVNEAARYFELCLINAQQIADLRGIGYGYYGLAECNVKGGAYNEAIRLMGASIKNRKRANHTRGLIQSYLKIGTYFASTNPPQIDSSVFYWKKAEALATEHQAADLLTKAYTFLYDYHFENDELPVAARYLKRSKNLADSIKNIEFINNVNQAKKTLEADLIYVENELLKQQQFQQEERETQKIVGFTLMAAAIIAILVATYHFRKERNRLFEKEQENKFTTTLLKLSEQINDPNLSFDEFLQTLLDFSRKDLDVDRASYWNLDTEKQQIALAAISKRNGSPVIAPAVFPKDKFPDFFSNFMKMRIMAVDEIGRDDRLRDIYELYYKPSGIETFMNAPVSVDSAFVGFLSYTMTNRKTRCWAVQEKNYVGSLVSLTVSAAVKYRSNLLIKERETLIRKLKSKNKSLKDFNNVLSHNIREPLTQILGLSNLVIATEADPNSEQESIISKINDSSLKMDRIINELTSVLNEEDVKPAAYEWISLEELILDTQVLFGDEMKKLVIKQQLNTHNIWSYKDHLIDICYQLVANALKFAAPSRPAVLTIDSSENKKNYLLRFSDNGRGINLLLFGNKIFKMYQRYHVDIEGRGMGLFIVKSRVEALNGTISVSSEEGVGSSFLIELPKLI